MVMIPKALLPKDAGFIDRLNRKFNELTRESEDKRFENTWFGLEGGSLVVYVEGGKSDSYSAEELINSSQPFHDWLTKELTIAQYKKFYQHRIPDREHDKLSGFVTLETVQGLISRSNDEEKGGIGTADLLAEAKQHFDVIMADNPSYFKAKPQTAHLQRAHTVAAKLGAANDATLRPQ